MVLLAITTSVVCELTPETKRERINGPAYTRDEDGIGCNCLGLYYEQLLKNAKRGESTAEEIAFCGVCCHNVEITKLDLLPIFSEAEKQFSPFTVKWKSLFCGELHNNNNNNNIGFR